MKDLTQKLMSPSALFEEKEGSGTTPIDLSHFKNLENLVKSSFPIEPSAPISAPEFIPTQKSAPFVPRLSQRTSTPIPAGPSLHERLRARAAVRLATLSRSNILRPKPLK